MVMDYREHSVGISRAFYGTFMMVIGFYSIILGACFLAVVYWVWDDDKRLRKLEEPSLNANT